VTSARLQSSLVVQAIRATRPAAFTAELPPRPILRWPGEGAASFVNSSGARSTAVIYEFKAFMSSLARQSRLIARMSSPILQLPVAVKCVKVRVGSRVTEAGDCGGSTLVPQGAP